MMCNQGSRPPSVAPIWRTRTGITSRLAATIALIVCVVGGAVAFPLSFAIQLVARTIVIEGRMPWEYLWQ